jgi:hypothetical protein
MDGPGAASNICLAMKLHLPDGCRAFITQALNDDRFTDGSLSLSHGFMPEEPALAGLPDYFEAWEAIAADVRRCTI